MTPLRFGFARAGRRVLRAGLIWRRRPDACRSPPRARAAELGGDERTVGKLLAPPECDTRRPECATQRPGVLARAEPRLALPWRGSDPEGQQRRTGASGVARKKIWAGGPDGEGQ